MTISRKLLNILLILFILTSATIWVLTRTLNPEHLREYIGLHLTKITKEPSEVLGNIKWQLFPHPGIIASNIQIGDEKNHSAYSITIDNMAFNLKITPLLRGNLVFNEVSVNSFKATIDAEHFNQNKKNVSKKSLENQSTPDQFAIEKLMLNRGEVTIHQHDSTLKLTKLQLGAEQMIPGREVFPFQLKTSLEYTQGDALRGKAFVQFKGNTSLPTSTRLRGQLLVKHATLNHLTIDKMSASMSFKNNEIQLNPTSLSLYQGESIGTIRYALSDKILHIDQTASGINSAALSKNFFDKEKITGLMDISLHVDVNMAKTDLAQALSGNGNINMKEGHIPSLNLQGMIIAMAPKLLNHEPIEDQNNVPVSGQTPLKLVSVPFQIEQGHLVSKSLLLETDKLQLKGDATFSLLDNSLTSHLTASGHFEDKKVNELQQLLGGSFPLLVKGDAATFSVVPDTSKIPVKEIAKTVSLLP